MALVPRLLKNSLFAAWIVHTSYTTLKLTLQLGSTSLQSLLRKEQNGDNNIDVNCQVLFFPDHKETCPLYLNGHDCGKKDCMYGHEETSLGKMVRCLSSAKKSIDVCVFTITLQHFADVLIKKHRTGVVVKVITDCEKMDLNCSQVEQMRANGIQVRHDKTSYFMHNKFAIVDKDTLINGSFNWTNQAVTGNQENVIISNHKDLVEPYCGQFDKLWHVYKPTV